MSINTLFSLLLKSHLDFNINDDSRNFPPRYFFNQFYQATKQALDFFSIQEDAVLFQHPLLSPCSGNSMNYTYFQMLKYCLSALSGTCCWICFLDQVESFRACTHERHQLVVFVCYALEWFSKLFHQLICKIFPILFSESITTVFNLLKVVDKTRCNTWDWSFFME